MEPNQTRRRRRRPAGILVSLGAIILALIAIEVFLRLQYASPLIVDGLIYTAAEENYVTCLEAATGQVVWTERIGGKYAASPVYADGRLYFFNQQGTTAVLKPGRAFEVLATNTLADGFMASPAVSGRAFFLRTRTHLYRIEASASEKGAAARR